LFSSCRTPSCSPLKTASERFAVTFAPAGKRSQTPPVRERQNLSGVRQTRWDPLLRPSPAADGRWAVDACAPLEGRNVNGGLRLTF
jgi:hypothetical protein